MAMKRKGIGIRLGIENSEGSGAHTAGRIPGILYLVNILLNYKLELQKTEADISDTAAQYEFQLSRRMLRYVTGDLK